MSYMRWSEKNPWYIFWAATKEPHLAIWPRDTSDLQQLYSKAEVLALVAACEEWLRDIEEEE